MHEYISFFNLTKIKLMLKYQRQKNTKRYEKVWKGSQWLIKIAKYK